MHPLLRATAAAVAALCAPHSLAQQRLPPVLVTGNPLGADAVVTPSQTLVGDGLVLRRAGTLGETLDGLPGVSSSGFGPNASRPVIRGLDGDRVRVLSNAGASIDASAVSVDHAVPIDPLAVERVEVLRGPAALLYGGGAIGGVVNAVDNRIPRAALGAADGVVEARLGGAADERGVSALVEGGVGALALHADAFRRRTGDQRAPLPGAASRVRNSASDASGGALGGSWTWNDGYLGASVDRYANDYGVVVEDEVTIAMERERVAVAGEARRLGGFWHTVRGHAATADYRHRELEGGEVGTEFANRGSDARVELVHAALPLAGGSLEGVFGLQAEGTRFQALGDEAFVPSTRTRQVAAFWLERWSVGAWQWSAGLRTERVRVASAGDAPGAAPRFGAASTRRFTPGAASLGAVWTLSPEWRVTGSAAATQRAPTHTELYANGLHVATAAYERGDATLALERGRNVDLALQWSRGEHAARLGVFASRFSNYLALRGTGETFVDDEGGSFPVQAFQGVRAFLHGLEGEARWRVLDAAPRTLDLELRFDVVRGDDRTNRGPLPRLAPARLTLGAVVQQGGWRLRGELRHAARQSRVPADDVPTAAWTLLDVALDRRLQLGALDALLFAKLQNVGDRLAYNAAATRSVREKSPLPGRGLLVGLRAGF